MRRHRGSFTTDHPLLIEFDLGFDERQSLRPTVDIVLHALLVGCEQRVTLVQRCFASFRKRRIFAHLLDRHAGAAQALHQIQPANVKIAVDAPSTAIPDNAGYQALSFIPTDGVNTTARSAGDLSDAKLPRHGLPSRSKPPRKAQPILRGLLNPRPPPPRSRSAIPAPQARR